MVSTPDRSEIQQYNNGFSEFPEYVCILILVEF